MEYVLLVAITYPKPLFYGESLQMADYAGMTWTELLAFINPSREHIKQNMFEFIETER